VEPLVIRITAQETENRSEALVCFVRIGNMCCPERDAPYDSAGVPIKRRTTQAESDMDVGERTVAPHQQSSGCARNAYSSGSER